MFPCFGMKTNIAAKENETHSARESKSGCGANDIIFIFVNEFRTQKNSFNLGCFFIIFLSFCPDVDNQIRCSWAQKAAHKLNENQINKGKRWARWKKVIPSLISFQIVKWKWKSEFIALLLNHRRGLSEILAFNSLWLGIKIPIKRHFYSIFNSKQLSLKRQRTTKRA